MAIATDKVTITPTYSGCPATDVIERTVREALDASGYRDVAIETVLTPPWTTEWISEQGKERLREYGIAPPELTKSATCPQCGSTDTEEVSRFGSTPARRNGAARTAWSRSTGSSVTEPI